MENTVETIMHEAALDDATLGLEQTEPAEQLSSLSEITDEPKPSTEATTEQSEPPAKEPGWIRRRVDAATAKAVRETETRMRAEFEAMLAPLRESMLDRQADELVRSGEFRSKERALEYVQMKNGVAVTAPAEAKETPVARDAQGRFAPKEQPTAEADDTSAVTRARANLLAAQAEKIQQKSGVDVMSTFRENPEIRQKVLSGEWDFHDVAEALTQRRVPMPMRASNGASFSGVSIANMTDEQFRRLNENLAAGKIYDAR